MRILTSKFSRPLILIFLISPAWASDGPSLAPQSLRVREKHLINNGIQVSVTPRGMKYFKTNLSEILTSQGLSPDKGYFAGFSKNFEQSYRVDDLGLPKTQRDLLITSLDLLNQWFGL